MTPDCWYLNGLVVYNFTCFAVLCLYAQVLSFCFHALGEGNCTIAQLWRMDGTGLTLLQNLPVLQIEGYGWADQLGIDCLYFLWGYRGIEEVFVASWVVLWAFQRTELNSCGFDIHDLVVDETFPPSDGPFQFIFPEDEISPHCNYTNLIGRTLKFEIDSSFLFIFEVPNVDKLIIVHLLLLLKFLLAKILVIKGIADS